MGAAEAHAGAVIIFSIFGAVNSSVTFAQNHTGLRPYRTLGEYRCCTAVRTSLAYYIV
eukprot:SAG31_NODE_36444_length_313_cov_0.948598_1_plen_57_part_01